MIKNSTALIAMAIIASLVAILGAVASANGVNRTGRDMTCRALLRG